MTIGKLWLVVLLGALPATAFAQPSVSADVSVGIDAGYDTTAPGVPIASDDVFYDQLAPYGVWVDDPQIGHVFIPQQDGYVPYTNGHWQYTSVGFVWVGSEPFADMTSHYGRWAYSQSYARWVWLPDTQWGPSWVEWQQAGDDFGWAPLAPEALISAGYSPPIQAWRYCGAAHILDTNVSRYYEPRARVVEINRQARPLHNYATVGNVRVRVGPSPATLRTYHVQAKPVKLDAKTIGRAANANEAHAQVVRAQQRKPQLEARNQQRVQANAHIHEVQQRVAPAKAEAKPATPREEPKRIEPARPEAKPATPREEPKRIEPARPEAKPATPREEPKRIEPARPEAKPATPREEPKRIEPARPEAKPATPREEPKRIEPARPEAKPATPREEPKRIEPAKPATPAQHATPVERAQPRPPEAVPPKAPAERPAPVQRAEPKAEAKPAAKPDKREPEHH